MGERSVKLFSLCRDLTNVEIFTKTIMHHNFYWVLQSSQEKSETMVMPNSGGWGGGVSKVHYSLGDNGELFSIPHEIRIGAALFANTTLSARVFRLLLLFRWFYASSPRAPSSFRCRRRAFFQFWLL